MQPTKQAMLFADLEDMPAVVKALQEAGLATQDAWKVWQDGFENIEPGKRPSVGDFETYIQEKIHLLQHQPEGKIKSKTGFLLDAIRKNYAIAKWHRKCLHSLRRSRRALGWKPRFSGHVTRPNGRRWRIIRRACFSLRMSMRSSGSNIPSVLRHWTRNMPR